MITTQHTHYPAPDDIEFESLEYLFGPAAAKPKTKAIPWVEIISDSERFDIIKEELLAKIEMLQLKNDVANSKLQRACIFIGYLEGLIHERDEQLKAVPDLRFRAAQAVVHKLEAERSAERIAELEAQVQRLSNRSKWKLEEILNLEASEESDQLAITLLNWLGVSGLTAFFFALLQMI